MNIDIERLDWSKGDGLLPAIVQHARDGRMLMLGYVNRESLQRTLADGEVWFYSRSRRRLWRKGESSGHVLKLRSLHADCDADALLLRVEPRGPTCHLGRASCFGEDAEAPTAFLSQLDALVHARRDLPRPGSYTAQLFGAGIQRIAQKVGEEGVETALAAVIGDDEALLGEAADLVYHLVVLLAARGLSLDDVAACLRGRHTTAD